jgi:thiamine-monophosphate kinase
MVVLTSEFALINEIRNLLPEPAEAGEIWIGDDAAVLGTGHDEWLLLAADTVAAGVHADLALTTLADFGWKSVAAAVSDIAAMGGDPGHALVTVAAPPGVDVRQLYEGIKEAAAAFRCPVVGGDLTNSDALVVTVAVTGHCATRPVLRSGARPGDLIWVTGPLGASSAGLRLYRTLAPAGPPGWAARLSEPERQALLSAHARPQARLKEGRAARVAGATAMIDVSDGLGADLSHLAEMSGVGIRLDSVPVAAGATMDDAFNGGEDLALEFCAPGSAPVGPTFDCLDTPIQIGRCTADRAERTIAGESFGTSGWEHAFV